MATNPSGIDIQLEINSTNNSTSILTVDGRFLVCTASPNEIYLSGCSTATGGNAIIYFMTRTNYGSSTSTNIFNAGTYDSRTFNTNATRALLGSNTSGDIYSSATNLGTAFNGGGSDIYYIYAANHDTTTTPTTWSNFVRCTFSNSVSGVSSYYFTVTWTNALRTITISGASSNIPANSSTNWQSAYGAVVLSSGDAGYALDLNLSGTTPHDNVWYATPYTTNVNSSTNPQISSNVGRTFGTSTNPVRLEDQNDSNSNEVTSIPTEGYATDYRLWGRIYPGTTNPNLTDGKYYDGYYYNGGLFTVCHPDTGVTVPSSTINITSSATQADVTVSDISSSDQNGFQWQYNGAASGTYGAGLVTPTSSNLPITTNLPAAGTSRVFGLFVKNFSTNSNTTALHSDWIDTGQTVTVFRGTATDTEPDAFDLGPPQTATSGNYVSSYNVTVSGINTSVSWSITNGSYTDVSFNNGVTWDTNATSGTISNGNTIRLRILAGSADRTSTLTIGTGSNNTDTFTVGPTAGSLAVGGSTASYGLVIKDANGAKVFDPSTRWTRIVAESSGTVSIAQSSYIDVSYTGVTTSNTDVYDLNVEPAIVVGMPDLDITRHTNYWRIRNNNSSFVIYIKWEVWRFG